MTKQKIILFMQEKQDCPLCLRIFNTQYEIILSHSKSDFLNKVKNENADVGVICFCTANEDDIDIVVSLTTSSEPTPILTCSKTLNPEFIRKAALRGVERFLLCDMEAEKIKDIIQDAIRDNGIRNYIELTYPKAISSSFNINKLVNEIIFVFPHRIRASELAERLGINRGWLHKLSKQYFGIPVTTFLRRIWVHQALRMIYHTNLDNTDISIQLDYKEESSMAREFRKELGFGPKEARNKLNTHSPLELINK